MITDFEIMGLWNGSEVTNGKTGTEETSADVLLSVFKHKVSENEAKAWKGPKQIVKDAYLISSSDNMLVRIAPTSLDATGTEFNMVNSKNHSLWVLHLPLPLNLMVYWAVLPVMQDCTL